MAHTEPIATDGSGDNHSAADIETIVVDPDDIITAFERNRRDETEQRSHVLRVKPTFNGEKTAMLHVSQEQTYYPPEMDPKPIHLGPEQFIGDDNTRLSARFSPPTYSEERGLFLEAQGHDGEWTDELEAEFEEWWDVSTEVWKQDARGALRDEITLRERTADGWNETTVEVRYEADSE